MDFYQLPRSLPLKLDADWVIHVSVQHRRRAARKALRLSQALSKPSSMPALARCLYLTGRSTSGSPP
jgi:hypothetical protein